MGKRSLKVLKLENKNSPIFLVAALSGFCNALLGAGGGILLTLTMGALLPHRFDDRRQLLVTTQAAMIPGCIVSCLIYAFDGMLDTTNFAIFAIPAMLGGALGSILLNKAKPRWINNIFSALVIWSGFRMIAR